MPVIPATAQTVAERWSKQLARADAQQPTQSGTNPTGQLRLAKGNRRHIDHLTWFRTDSLRARWTAKHNRQSW